MMLVTDGFFFCSPDVVSNVHGDDLYAQAVSLARFETVGFPDARPSHDDAPSDSRAAITSAL
tara:strand:- start:131 stop:316 length:186 start_codon:yes stop_codon:yes gene_type:complete